MVPPFLISVFFYNRQCSECYNIQDLQLKIGGKAMKLLLMTVAYCSSSSCYLIYGLNEEVVGNLWMKTSVVNL